MQAVATLKGNVTTAHIKKIAYGLCFKTRSDAVKTGRGISLGIKQQRSPVYIVGAATGDFTVDSRSVRRQNFPLTGKCRQRAKKNKS